MLIKNIKEEIEYENRVDWKSKQWKNNHVQCTHGEEMNV